MTRWIPCVLALTACGAPAMMAAPITVARATVPARPAVDTCSAVEQALRSTDAAHVGLNAWLAAPPTEQLDPSLHGPLELSCGLTGIDGGGAACAVLGVMYETGDGAPRDPRRAAKLFALAAEHRGYDLGGIELAAPAASQAIRWRSSFGCRVAKSCPEGCEAACEAGLVTARAASIAPLERACEEGRAAACFLAAELDAYGSYLDPLGWVVEHSEEAAALYDRACSAGIGRACVKLGWDLAVPLDDDGADLPGAMALYQRGCELGAGPACIELAAALDRDDDEASHDPQAPQPPLSELARATYERACHLGMHAICADLGSMYATGDRVPLDPGKSAALLRLAE